MIPKVSVIIPVYNGRKTIRKTIKSVLRQNYKNYEIIVVENGSSDNTWGLLQKIALRKKNIHIYKNDVKGTLHARHKGVELAKGEYIVFLDSGDTWVGKSALTEMISYALKEQASVTQFGIYRTYACFRKYKGLDKKKIICREELLSKEIAGTMGANGFDLVNYVWNKVYRTNILKRAFVLPDKHLIYSEDMYINLCVMFDDAVERIAIIPKAYTLYRVGIGVSSDTGVEEKLLEEYCVTKSMAIDLAKGKGSITTYPLYRAHRESIYFYRALIIELIRQGIDKKIVLSKINEIEKYPFVIEAKRFLSKETTEKLETETVFLSGNYSSEEYYLHCKELSSLNKPVLMKRKVKNALRNLLKKVI